MGWGRGGGLQRRSKDFRLTPLGPFPDTLRDHRVAIGCSSWNFYQWGRPDVSGLQVTGDEGDRTVDRDLGIEIDLVQGGNSSSC